MRLFMLLAIFILITPALSAQSPEWLWASAGGGAEEDWAYAVATDTLGNSYLAGIFEETAFFGIHYVTSETSWPNKNIFVAKLDPQGNWLWAISAGGNSHSGCRAIAVDDYGDIYITGFFYDTFSAGDLSVTSVGECDAFFAKLSTDGDWLWLFRGGGVQGADIGNDIALDETGTPYFVGEFYGEATFHNQAVESAGNNDAFIVNISPYGSWGGVMTLGGTSWDEGIGIAFNRFGDMIVTGRYMGSMSIAGQTITSQGGSDIFIACYSYLGDWYWLKSGGGSGFDYGHRITTDAAGDCYVTGGFTNTAYFGSNTLYGGTLDIFVARLDADGNWIWVTSARGVGEDYVMDIDTDKSGNIYLAGLFRRYLWFDSMFLYSTLDSGGYLAKLDPSSTWLWPMQIGDIGINEIRAIDIDKAGNVYCAIAFSDYLTLGDLYVTGDNMTAMVAKYGIKDETLPVVLSSLLVNYLGNLSAEIQWVTESETGILGYNILRNSDPEISSALVLNSQIIDEGTSIGSQTTYNFQDLELEAGNTYYYWLECVSLSGDCEYFGPLVLSAEQTDPEHDPDLPELVNTLLRPFPNPFNPLVIIPFRLVEAASVEISIYNSRGQMVKSLPTRALEPGYHQSTWDGISDRGAKSGSGVYIVKACINGRSYQSRIVMMK